MATIIILLLKQETRAAKKGGEILKPFSLKIQDDLRVETDGPREKRNPSQNIVQELQGN